MKCELLVRGFAVNSPKSVVSLQKLTLINSTIIHPFSNGLLEEWVYADGKGDLVGLFVARPNVDESVDD
jgi:hypothetical protein